MSVLVNSLVEVDLVRNESFYFYNRRENGRSIVSSQRIARDRARQIYEANADNDWQRKKGLVNFDPAPCEWSWTTRLTV